MKRQVLLVLVASLFIFTLIGFASAATEILKPANGTTISGTNVNLTTNCSDVTVAAVGALVNYSYYVMSPSTANSTWTLIARQDLYNRSSSGNVTSALFNLSGVVEDSNDYIMNVTIRLAILGTFQGNALTLNNITFDYTVPAVPTYSTANFLLISTPTNQTFGGVHLGPNSISCSYSFNRGSSASSGPDYTTGSGVYTATACAFSKNFATDSDSGDWYYYVTDSDGTNTTAGAVQQVQVRIPASGGAGGMAVIDGTFDEKYGAGADNSSPLSIGGDIGGIPVSFLAVVGIILVIAIFVKKRR